MPSLYVLGAHPTVDTSKKAGVMHAMMGEVEGAIDSRERQQREGFPG